MNENKKYRFSYTSSQKVLVCPQCYEMLVQHDIESFSHCPYCNFKFELSHELEDFLLAPIVDQWVKVVSDTWESSTNGVEFHCQ